MEEDFSNSSGLVLLSDNDIRSVQTNLQAKLEDFHKKVPDAKFIETYSVCENVKEILNYEDESHLSKVHNNSRKISIASELFISICSAYSYIVDFEYTKIIEGLIQWERFKHISKKITYKKQLELKKEKYFEKEAHTKLDKSPQDREDGEREVPKAKRKETVAKAAAADEKTSPVKEKDNEMVAAVDEETHIDEISEVEGLTSAYSVGDEISNVIGNITEVRAESPTDTSRLQILNSHVERQKISLPTAIPEIPIQDTTFRQNADDDINNILQILEGEIIEKEVGEMELPGTLLETTNIDREPAGEAQTHEENGIDQSEVVEEWDLPELETPKMTKKKQHVIIDKIIKIHNYSERALYLNNNIKIQRVQVYEGPPKILQAMSVGHMMKTPGFKSSLFQDRRSSKLTRLFERHLKVEKKPVECIPPPQTKRDAVVPRETEFPTVRANEEVMEDFGKREGQYSMPGKGEVLAEITKEKTHLEDIEIPAVGAPQKESLVGIPVSRIISSAIEPLDMEKINNVSVLHTPRVQQLQGKSLDADMHSSWFHSVKVNPPSAKYREFNYVYKKVQECWSLFESQGMEKSITLREFFHFEADSSVANFLTVLRILDKLSIQRKLLLKYQNRDVLIQPFEYPFVSEKQLLLKERLPIF